MKLQITNKGVTLEFPLGNDNDEYENVISNFQTFYSDSDRRESIKLTINNNEVILIPKSIILSSIIRIIK